MTNRSSSGGRAGADRLGARGSVVHHLALLAALCALGGVLVAGMLAPVVGTVGLIARDTARAFNSLPADFVTPPLPERSVVLAANGSVLVTFHGPVDRIEVPITDIPIVMQQAIVAIEDDRFYLDGGIDYYGIVRAFVRDAQSGSAVEGASTLTQQYVKNVLLDTAVTPAQQAAAVAKTIPRKLEDARFAITLARRLSKLQILDNYLNIVYFGEGAYGIDLAAQRYFQETPEQLTLPQAALLAGLVQAPSAYDPVVNPALGLARRNVVLARMAQLHYITAAQARAAEATSLGLHPTPFSSGDSCVGTIAPFYCSYVRQLLLADPALGATQAQRIHELYEGGLTIHTTLEPAVQIDAQRGVDATVPVTNRVGMAAVVMQPGTGKVLAMAVNRVYGNGPGQTTLNLATVPFADPGSSMKLFTLTAALKQGLPLTTHFYAPACYVAPGGAADNPVNPGQFCPVGFSNAAASDTGTWTIPPATWYSINTFFVQLEAKVGVLNVIHTAESMGIPPALLAGLGPHSYSLTLGGLPDGVSPLDMAAAYSVVAAQGIYCPPVFVTSITQEGGTALPLPAHHCVRVLPRVIANTVTSVLQGVIDQPGGTGYGVADIGRPAAGKTGTATNYRAGWFVGYTPQLTTAVMSADPRGPDKYPLVNVTTPNGFFPQVYGATLAAPAFALIMRAALAGLPVEPFPLPAVNASGILTVPVPDLTGDTRAAAIHALAGTGLSGQLAQGAVDSTAPAGTVAYTSPPAGVSVPAGSTVTVYVSNGTAPTPTPTTSTAPTTPSPTPTGTPSSPGTGGGGAPPSQAPGGGGPGQGPGGGGKGGGKGG